MQNSIFFSRSLYLFFSSFKGYYCSVNDTYMDMPSYYGDDSIKLTFKKLTVRFPPYGI